MSRVFHGCLKGVKTVTRVLKGVTQAFQGCYISLTRMIQGVVRGFHCCCNEVIRVLLGLQKGVSCVSRGSYMGVSMETCRSAV